MEKKVLIKFFFSAIIIHVFFPGSSSSQNNADHFFNHNRFEEALELYLPMLKADSLNSELNFKIGKCYLESRSQKEKAITFLEGSVGPAFLENHIKINAINSSPLAYKYLGDAYFLSRKLGQALKSYEIFLENYSCNHYNFLLSDSLISDVADICKEVKRKMELCNFGIKISGSVECPFFSKNDDVFFEENLIPAEIHIPAMDSLDSVKKAKQYEATIATSTDGQVILIYKDVRGKAELFTTTLTENKWTSREKLNKPINNAGWEINECISADGSVMYFTSSRPEGFGGKDIYQCKKLQNGEWGIAKNLGPLINTLFDEEAPFICPDKTTLYFSSDKNHKGEFDVFSSILTDGETFARANPSSGPTKSTDSVFHWSGWLGPVKSGFPVNSLDEASLINENQAMISAAISSQASPGKSDLPGLARDEKEEQLPNSSRTVEIIKEPLFNYIASFYSPGKKPLILIKGGISDVNGNIPGQVKISVRDNESGKIMGLYFVDNKGQYSFLLTCKNNNITFESDGYLFHSENYDLSKDSVFFERTRPIVLAPVIAGSAIVLNNIFFEKNKPEISAFSLPELSTLLIFLKNNQEVKMELSYRIATDKNNRKPNAILAQKRAQNVIKFLFDNGIQKERMAAKGYGKLPGGMTSPMEFCEMRITENGLAIQRK